MALNKYMHPRNIYRTPPNFADLAKQYSEFSSIAKVDVAGKVTIDFKDPNALRILTKSLLKSDFDLDIIIPEDKLVPTLPLRLNYILWIEDLLNSIQRKENIKGIDIGTGACVIYPIIAAVKNKWQMIGTDSDESSLKIAEENLKNNNLQNMIELKKNSTSTIIYHYLSEENKNMFDFCMCNPPFYSNLQELCESRSPARPPPKNGFTGSPQELITEGGELKFCRKLIDESKTFKDKILLYTTMVGHKYNLKELEQDLQAEGISHTTTEFCQGRVTRWGLAWTYKNYDIKKLVPPREKPPKNSTPLTFLLPKITGVEYTIDGIAEKLRAMMDNLKIKYKVLERKGGFYVNYDIKAKENTWSNQRRKRRLMKKQIDETSDDTKRSKRNDSNTDSGCSELVDKCDYKLKLNKTNSDPVEDTICENIDLHSENENYILHAFLKVLKSKENILMQTEFLEGRAGKEGVHQIVQYIKNNWK